MKKRPSGWCTGFTLALVVGLFLACNGIRQDEFACENAVMHMQECCHGFSGSNVDCTYVAPSGCDTTTVYPELSIDQSSCILAESCDSLVATGVCTRVAALPNQGTYSESSDYGAYASSPSPTVCP
jgi:hypothetical protein